MPLLWRFCQAHWHSKPHQKKAFLVLNTLLFGILGLFVWLLVRLWALDSGEWAAVFIGYPAYLFGLLGGAIRLYNV